MIRLVTQFDDTRIRATVATPTCGSSSCCCCCCLATVLTTSTLTAMHAGGAAAKTGDSRPSATSVTPGFGRAVWGFLALPLALALGIATTYGAGNLIAGIGVAIVTWMVLLLVVYSRLTAANRWGVIVPTVVLGAVFLTAEFFVFLYVFIELVPVYLALAVAVPMVVVTVVSRKWRNDLA